MTNEFTREARYAVLKSADVMQCLTVSELIELRRIQAKVEEHRAEIGKPPLDCVVVESDWPEYEPTWKAIEARVTGTQPTPKAVAYLDLGVGGYMDIGTNLTDEALAAIPKGRHMLGIVGTYGVDGYVSTQSAPSVPEGWLHHAARMAALARKLREPDWHFESIREMQHELHALEEAALAALAVTPEAKPCP